MSSITRGDFDFYKKELDKDRRCHEEMYLRRIEPDVILAYYEGTRNPSEVKYSGGSRYSATDDNLTGDDLSRIALNKIFPATNTVATSLYPNNPGFTAGARRQQDEYPARIAQEAMNYYFDEMNAVDANQRAIISAWLYGFGAVKQGWRTVFKRKSSVTMNDSDAKNKLPTLAERMGITLKEPGDINVEQDNDDEFIAFEEPFIYHIDNNDIILDRTQPFGKGKTITQHFKKSLYDIRKSGLYELDDEFINKYSKKKDQRTVTLDLYEKWILLPDGWHILVVVDDWKKPLRWDRSPYMHEGNAFELIRLNLEPRATYPVSHMKAAQRIHREMDYILSLQLKHLRKHRSMDLFYEKALDPNTKNAIKTNEIGGYGFSSKPLVEGVHQHIGGNTIPADLFNMQQILTDNLMEILTISGARIDASNKKETATENKITEFGNQLRTQTMQDQVNAFLKRQGRKLLQDIKQFATSPILLKITGLNELDPQTGQPVTEQWVEFATPENPVALKDAIQGDYDIDIDAVNLARRDTGLIRLQMEQMLNLLGNPVMQQLLANEGTRFNMTEFLKDIFENFETLTNPEKYFTQNPQQPQEEQREPVEVGENITKMTEADDLGNKIERTQKEKVFA